MGTHCNYTIVIVKGHWSAFEVYGDTFNYIIVIVQGEVQIAHIYIYILCVSKILFSSLKFA
jgi:hypothetical protein